VQRQITIFTNRQFKDILMKKMEDFKDEKDEKIKKMSGWSNTNFSSSFVVKPENIEQIKSTIRETKDRGGKIIAIGAGQSYGDQGLNDKQTVIDISKINDIIEWNKSTGILKIQAGVTFEKILIHCLKDNWVLPVVPGTRHVTVGGAISSNVHGKNSYSKGNFGDWVKEFKIILASSECIRCSRENNRDLFFAVIGGCGLFGIITEITLQLIQVPSPFLSIKKSTSVSLDKLISNLDEMAKKNEYAIAQVDCFPKNNQLGRGTIHAGSFVSDNSKFVDTKKFAKISKRIFLIFPKKLIPLIGRCVLNDHIMRLVSGLKYYVDKMVKNDGLLRQDFFQFTFFLDGIPGWKKVFGHGFYEYEPLIPREKAGDVMARLIRLTHEYKMPPYLSAVKIHKKDEFLLSYSMDGYSLAMDIPRRPQEKEKQNELFRKMNKIVIDAGGIVYLTKDANLTPEEFRFMYKNIERFLALKRKYDPDLIFQSDMYRRIFQNNAQIK